jgi:drug/metabolite transporter (DMT)-like permease
MPDSPAPVSRRAALLALLFTDACWGVTFFLMKWGTDDLAAAIRPAPAAYAPLLFLALRFTAAAILLPLAIPGVLRKATARGIGLGALLAVPFAAGFLLQIYGLRETSPAVSAFLTSLFVVFTPLLGWAFGRERPSAALWGGAALALGGALLMAGPLDAGFGRGEWLTLACAAAFAVQILLTDSFTRRADPDVITWSMIASTAAATLVALSLLPGGAALLAPDALGEAVRRPPVAWSLAVTAVLATVIALAVMNRFQRHVTPSRAALVYAFEPVFAAAYSLALCRLVPAGFTEEVTWTRALGALLILGGNVWAEAKTSHLKHLSREAP